MAFLFGRIIYNTSIMKIIADFHIHSPYSRAVSRAMTLENLDFWAKIKGITVMGTGDFTHPAWIKEIKAKLEPAEAGLYRLNRQATSDKRQGGETRFILTSEISSIYSKGGKVRRIHSLIFFPSIAGVEEFNAIVGARGNLKADGRPIVGIDAKELLKIALGIDSEAFFVPAHCWTPWFSVFGSKSGFDSMEECFDEYAKYIYAVETGLSSDPSMNWRVSALDKYALLSNSDSHSLRRIGREANIFDTKLSYADIIDAIKTKDPKKFLSTVEFFPEEGMYHYDGHRACKIRFHPAETKKAGSRCPACKSPMTIGVMSRIEEFADRPEGFKPKNATPFKNMVPLDEIIAESFGVKSALNKRVQETHQKMINDFGSEMSILFDHPISAFSSLPEEIAEGIKRVREGKLFIDPGYDGEYGTVKIFKNYGRKSLKRQA